MSFIDKWLSKAQERLIQSLPDNRILVEAAIRRGIDKPLSERLQYESVLRSAQNLKKWKNAVSGATDPVNPTKLGLWQFYDNLLLDNHLRSCIDTRVTYVQRSPYKMVDDKGVENPEVTWLLERPWMDDLKRFIVLQQFEGTKVLELWHLKPNGELSQVNEVPSPYFNTLAGIITEELDGTTGVSYREAPYADFYVQIGKDNDLGELERLGPIVLAKKLALGSYQDYIEKYGVPPLFITTDREDQDRLDKLFEAAKNFKSNQFMVGRGQEKFEIGTINGTGTAPFNDLFKFANDEISKAILGGTGLTDEKGFVGSVNVQFELTKNRMESDRMLFKYLFNEEIKPRLVKLSPIYKPLENYYFEWDNTESLNMSSYIDAVQKLGNLYEIDPEQIEERTGLKILGIKQNTTFGQPPGGGDPGK
ncbi:hypothetical protein D3C72_344380 [compost metagenome]